MVLSESVEAVRTVSNARPVSPCGAGPEDPVDCCVVAPSCSSRRRAIFKPGSFRNGPAYLSRLRFEDGLLECRSDSDSDSDTVIRRWNIDLLLDTGLSLAALPSIFSRKVRKGKLRP